MRGGFFLLVTQRFYQDTFGSNGGNFIDGGHGVTRPNVSSIDLVVLEVFSFQGVVFITDQTVFGYGMGIEFNLNLYILGNWEKCGTGFIDQYFPGFVKGVDIGGVALSVLG